jgi:hypothetical protein
MSSEKIERFWENATAKDVERVMAGETVEARFRDDEGGKWLESDHSLGGYDSTEEFCKWISSTGCPWRFCQVYREPSWWTERPDPGPEYRLLGKFPDEELKLSDEFYREGVWNLTCKESGSPHAGYWYRRRIEPVEPEPKHYVLRVGDSVETPSGHLIKVVSPGVEQIEFKLKAGFTATLPNGQTITATEKGFEVTQ